MQSSTNINPGEKQLLAKLMAEENITVIHRQCSTAKFDLAKRVLILPIWKDMESFTYRHLIGHEVSHALHTLPGNAQGWDDAIDYIDSEHRNVAKQFLNICEDVRIEQLILAKYPGLRMDFRKSYKKLLEDNMFGTEGKDLTKLPLADRVNIQAKLGSLIELEFDEKEQDIMDEITRAYTWDQTVVATKRLYEYCSLMENPPQPDDSDGEDEEGESGKKSKKKPKKNNKKDPNKEDYEDDSCVPEKPKDKSKGEGQDDSEGESDKDSEGDPEDGFDGDEAGDSQDSDGSSDNSGDDEGDGEGEDGASSNSNSSANGISASSGRGKEKVAPSCSTQQAFESNADALIDKNAKNIEYFNIPKAILEKLIVPWKEVIPNIKNFYVSKNKNKWTEGELGYKQFRGTNKPFIDYMVQQFTLKKAADDSQKVTIAKTGMIDVGQLYAYKFSDDIFRRSAILPGEKNHALVMFVDFSGSMSSHMRGTIEQALNTAEYCRKINVPFELYSFGACGDQSRRWSTTTKEWDATGDDFAISNFNLRQYFGIGMSQMQHHEACVALYSMCMQYGASGGLVPPEESLGGTPLNETVIAAFTIVDNLKKKTKAQIITVAVITDGEGYQLYNRVNPVSGNFDSILRDPVNRMEYRMSGREQTTVLLEALRNRSNVNAIGFYICSGNASSVKFEASHMSAKYDRSKKVTENQIQAFFEDNNYYSIQGAGYEEYFVIAGGKDIGTATDIKRSGDETADFIAKAKQKIKKRVVLGRFVEIMARQSKKG